MCLVVKFSTVSAIRAASALLILTHFPTTTGSGEKNTPNQNFIQPFFFSRYRCKFLEQSITNTINKFSDLVPVIPDFSINLLRL